MYFGRLHKKTPENCSIKVLEKSFLARFWVLEYFSITRNDQIFLFSRTLLETYIRMNLCILFDYTRKHPKDAVTNSSKKVFMVGFGFSNIFRLLETTKIFFFLGHFQRLISAWTYVFWLITRENTRKLQYQNPQKKFLWSVSGSRIFFEYSKRPNFSFT